MGNKLFVVLQSIAYESVNQFRGMFAKKEEAFALAKQIVAESCRPEKFSWEDGRWTSDSEDIEVYEVEVGVPFEKKDNGWVRE